jgi:hypothetical protein
MKISQSALLFLLFEVKTSNAFSGYLSSLGDAKIAPSKPASYSPFGSDPSSVIKSTPGQLGSQQQPYSSFNQPAPVQLDATPVTANTLPADYMKALGSSGIPKAASYSGFNTKPRAPENGADYLSVLNTAGPVASSSYTKPAPVSTPVTSAPSATTSYTAPKVASPATAASNTSYMASMSGGSKVKPASYAPFGSKPKKVSSSYAPFGSLPKAVPEQGYFANLGNAAPATSSSAPEAAAVSSPALTAGSAKKASYSPFGSLPKVVPVQGYFANLNASPSSAAAVSPAQSAPAAGLASVKISYR